MVARRYVRNRSYSTSRYCTVRVLYARMGEDAVRYRAVIWKKLHDSTISRPVSCRTVQVAEQMQVPKARRGMVLPVHLSSGTGKSRGCHTRFGRSHHRCLASAPQPSSLFSCCSHRGSKRGQRSDCGLRTANSGQRTADSCGDRAGSMSSAAEGKEGGRCKRRQLQLKAQQRLQLTHALQRCIAAHHPWHLLIDSPYCT